MRALIQVTYVVMLVWLVVAGVIRIALLLVHHLALDALPFVSIGIALVALVLLAIVRHHDKPPRDEGSLADRAAPAQRTE